MSECLAAREVRGSRASIRGGSVYHGSGLGESGGRACGGAAAFGYTAPTFEGAAMTAVLMHTRGPISILPGADCPSADLVTVGRSLSSHRMP
jgi:hypothetical protein